MGYIRFRQRTYRRKTVKWGNAMRNYLFDALEKNGKAVMFVTDLKVNNDWHDYFNGIVETRKDYYVTCRIGNCKCSLLAMGHKGRHNICGVRYDVWFTYHDNKYHGVKYGDNNDIVYVKRIKR